MIYDGQFAADRVGARLMERSVAAGEEARIRASLPLKMLHVDDSVALVALAIARASNMCVRTVRRHISAILELLGVNSRFAAGAMAARRGLI
jgi:hypothetical protein